MSQRNKMINAHLSYAKTIYYSKKNPSHEFTLIVCRHWAHCSLKKRHIQKVQGYKCQTLEVGDDTNARVFHLSGRALWTLSTQSCQRVASITVTVSATCNVGNDNSFKTLQWGVTALCRTRESHLWQVAENQFWTQSFQRAICFDSSLCFLFKLSLDLIDDPFLSQHSLFHIRWWEKTNGKRLYAVEEA